MLQKTLVALLWFPLTLVLLVANLVLLAATAQKVQSAQKYSPTQLSDTIAVAASSGTGQVLGATVTPGDARSLLLSSYLLRHESPMAPYAGVFTELADLYHIDYRLAPAIAMCESNLGKRLPLKSAYNAWGIRCYTGEEDRCKQFTDWPHAIGWVMEYIYQNYFAKGITDLRDIGAIWAPPSVEKDYSWTSCVQRFMGEIQ